MRQQPDHRHGKEQRARLPARPVARRQHAAAARGAAVHRRRLSGKHRSDLWPR